jgi:predicted DNA-binding transcriptional regulator AlpA
MSRTTGISNVSPTSAALWSVKSVAVSLGISIRQTWKLAATGRIPQPIRLGRSVRWKASDIQRFLEANCDMQSFGAAIAAGVKL